MTRITYMTSTSRPAKLAAAIAISTVLAVTVFVTPASADWDGHHRSYNHYYNGGYYAAPPVVYGSPYGQAYYGSPYYYPPPVVYGPSVGINLGGIGIGIR
jgi:hypothetical protein